MRQTTAILPYAPIFTRFTGSNLARPGNDVDLPKYFLTLPLTHPLRSL
jgi:hypothetical protein